MEASTPIHKLFPYIAEICRINQLPVTTHTRIFRDGILSQVSGKVALSDFLSNLETYFAELHMVGEYRERDIVTFYDILRTLAVTYPSISVPTIDRYENVEMNYGNETNNPNDDTNGNNESDDSDGSDNSDDLMKPKCEAWIWLAGFITARVFSQ